ncbi:MAG: asparagine synthase (glutamine-hydrolyzing) [Rubritalea sp.]
MCGILVNTASVAQISFDRALDSLKHRGPDALGSYIWADVNLGHSRLSIIDLGDQSNQPFLSDDGNLVIVYNGEIYNYKEIAKRHGLRCRTGSDTEVLLKLYEKLGANCLDELNGMFAFVVLHKDSGKIFAARDRLGIKPLYLDRREASVSFSSEMGALLELNSKVEWDFEGLRQYIKLRACIGSKTIYKNIEMLPPGHYFDDGKISCYWSMPEGEQAPPSDDELRALIVDAIQIRKVCDVPIGSYLSGGLDSTIVAGVANVNDVWSVGFDNSNEFEYSEMAAEAFGLEHHACLTTKEEFLATASGMVKQRREPLGVPNEVLIYLMTKQVKKKNTVVLSGEGADELFFGYDRIFRWAGESQKFDLKEFDQNYCYGSHKDDQILDAALGRFSGERVLTSVARFFQTKHLHGLLRRLDNSTMAASVEARVPFVDHRLVEMMAGVSIDYRMEKGVVKAPLKRVFRDLVPEPIITRKKVGFPVPLAEIFGITPAEGKTFMDHWLIYNLEVLSGNNNLYLEVINSIKN